MGFRTSASTRNWVLKKNGMDLFLTYILFFPPIMHGMGQSYSLGIVICAASLIPFYSKVIFNGFARVRTFLLATFLLVYSPISLLVNSSDGRDPDLMRLVLGLLAIISLMVLASIFSFIYQKELTKQKSGVSSFQVFTVLAIYSHVILFLRFAEFSPTYSQINSRLGLFSEPSHICFITSVLLFIKFSSSTRRVFVLYFMGAIVFVVSIESLVGIVSLICLAFVLANRHQKIAVGLTCVTLMLFLSASNNQLRFIIENLRFAGEAINLTGAVYLSGWERAFLNLMETNLIGLGINQFGVSGNQGSYTDLIVALSGVQANQFDGSFMFAKLTAELGVFSLFLTAYLVSLWVNCYVKNKYFYNPITLGFLSSFIILYFLRSPGYVCGASVLMISLITNPQLVKMGLRFSITEFSHVSKKLNHT